MSASLPPLEGKKILITGGGGFIGSHLAKALVAGGNRVMLLDACAPASSSAQEMGLFEHQSITYLQADILDKVRLEGLPSDFDYILHTAGILGIQKVSERPLLTADVNVLGTRHLLDLAVRQKQLARFVLFSTSEVYGPHASNVEESSPSIIPNIGMRWVYASSKQFSEYLLKAFIQERSLPGVIVRPFNVYGPYRRGSNALTSFVRGALDHATITLTGNGEQSRCWCHVDDFIEGVLGALTAENIIGEAFNLGNDAEPLSMKALAEKICALTHSRSHIHILGSEEEDVWDRKPNIAKARKLLHFDPQVDLTRGIHSVVHWISHRFPSYACS